MFEKICSAGDLDGALAAASEITVSFDDCLLLKNLERDELTHIRDFTLKQLEKKKTWKKIELKKAVQKEIIKQNLQLQISEKELNDVIGSLTMA